MRLGQTTHVTTYAFHMFAMVLKWLSMVFPMVFQESAMVFSWFPMIFKMVAMAFNRLPFSQQKTWPETSSKIVNAPKPDDKCYDLCFPHVCNGSEMTLNGVSNGFQERAMVFYWFPIIFQMVAMVFNRLHFGQQKTWPDTSSKVVNAPRPNDKCYALHMFALVLRWLSMVFPMVFQERAMVFWWFPMIFQIVAMVFNWLHFIQQKTWPDKSSKVVNAPRPNDKCYDLCFPHVCNGSKMTLNGVSSGFPTTCNGLLMISNDVPNGCNGFQQVAFSQQKNITGKIIKSCQCAEAKRQIMWFMFSPCLQWF